MPSPFFRSRTTPVPPTPLTLGAIEWHRADAVTFSGGPTSIQTFDDLSLNGRVVTLSTNTVNARATQLPTSAPNSQPSASAPNPFAGTTTGYDGLLNYQLQDTGGGWSIMSVLKPDAAIDGNLIYRFAYSSSDDNGTQFDGGNHWWTPFDTPGQLRASMTSGGLAFGGGDVVTAAGAWTYFLFSCDWGANEIRVYRLGGLDQSAAVADVGSDRTLVGCYLLRGSRGGSSYNQFDAWFGELADLSVYPYALHSVPGAVALANQYVGDRYGAAMIANAGSAREARAMQAARDMQRHRRWSRRGRVYVPARAGVDVHR
jgi:hypothetical protein